MNSNHLVSLVALRSLPFFRGLSDELLTDVSSVANMRRFGRNQSVVQAGDLADNIYFILTGSLKVLVNDQDGREVIFTLLNQGELFGEMALFEERPRSANVVATSAVD